MNIMMLERGEERGQKEVIIGACDGNPTCKNFFVVTQKTKRKGGSME